MSDVIFCRSKNARTYWLVGETHAGKKFIRNWFDTTPGYIREQDLEKYIEYAREEDLEISVY